MPSFVTQLATTEICAPKEQQDMKHCICVTLLLLLASSAFGQRSSNSTDSQGQDRLSPLCDGRGYIVANRTGDSSLHLFSSRQSSAMFFFECFSFLRLPNITGDAQCREDALRSEFLLTFQPADGVGNNITVPLTDIYGGSITSTTYEFSKRYHAHGHFLTKTHGNSACGVNLHFSLTLWTLSNFDPLVTARPPRMRTVSPFVALKGQPQTFTFIRPMLGDIAQNPDRFFVADARTGCGGSLADSNAQNAPLPTYSSAADSGLSYVNSDEVVATWTFNFQNHGGYFICVVPSGFRPTAAGSEFQSVELGFIDVFGGNPAFFTIEGSEEPAQMELNREYNIVFEGVGLDLRPERDMAKFVDARTADNCSVGRPAFISASTDLGPTDNVGFNVTQAHWRVTLTSGGSYWICYKRYGHDWVNVPPLRLTGPNVQSVINDTSHLHQYHRGDTYAPSGGTATPIPTERWETFSPAPDNGCLQEARQFIVDHRLVIEGYVNLYVNRPEAVNDEFHLRLAEVLCIPPDLLFVSVPREVVRGDMILYRTRVEAACTMECSNDRKMQYLNFIVSTDVGAPTAMVRSLGVVSSDLPQGRVSVGPQDGNSGNSRVVTFIIVFAIIAIVLAVLGFCFYMYRRRHNENQIHVGTVVEDGTNEMRSGRVEHDTTGVPFPAPASSGSSKPQPATF